MKKSKTTLHRPPATADEATAPLPVPDAAPPAAVPDALPPAAVPDAPRGTEKRSRTRVRRLRALQTKAGVLGQHASAGAFTSYPPSSDPGQKKEAAGQP